MWESFLLESQITLQIKKQPRIWLIWAIWSFGYKQFKRGGAANQPYLPLQVHIWVCVTISHWNCCKLHHQPSLHVWLYPHKPYTTSTFTVWSSSHGNNSTLTINLHQTKKFQRQTLEIVGHVHVYIVQAKATTLPFYIHIIQYLFH